MAAVSAVVALNRRPPPFIPSGMGGWVAEPPGGHRHKHLRCSSSSSDSLGSSGSLVGPGERTSNHTRPRSQAVRAQGGSGMQTSV